MGNVGARALPSRVMLSTFVTALAVFSSVLFSCSRDDPPTGPGTGKDYVFYFNDASYDDRYFRYHTATGVVDTLTIPYSSYEGLAVSADGKFLYLSDNDKTVVLTTDSLEIVTEIDFQGRIAVSPDNRLIAVLGPTTRILSTPDYSEIFSDTVTTYRGYFSVNSDRLYCVGGPGIVKFDLTISPIAVTTQAFTDIVLLVMPTIDEQMWFVYRRLYPLWTYDMIVYDQVEDTVVYNKVLQPGAGEFELTPDGRRCFVTNPGTLSPGPTPSQAVLVFEIERNEVMDSIPTPSPVNGSMIPRLLAITPDGKTLIAAGARGQGEFSVIDVGTLTVVEHHYLGNTVDFWDVACQNGR